MVHESDQKYYKWMFLGLGIGILIHLLNKSYNYETLLKCINELLPSEDGHDSIW